MAQTYNNLVHSVDEYLHQPGALNDYLDKGEKLTGVKRIYFAQALTGIFAAYMVFGHFAQLICNFVGFAYPCYASIKAIETTTKNDDTAWLTYWVVFSVFNVVEFFSDVILGWFPLYWLAKILLLVWCFLPIKHNGRDYVYQNIVRPVFLRNSARIDAKVDALASKVKETIVKEVIKSKLEHDQVDSGKSLSLSD